MSEVGTRPILLIKHIQTWLRMFVTQVHLDIREMRVPIWVTLHLLAEGAQLRQVQTLVSGNAIHMHLFNRPLLCLPPQ